MKQEKSLEEYLTDSPYLLLTNQTILELSNTLVYNCKTEVEKITKIYEYVRDQFPHSIDCKATKVSVNALDVINNGHGICYAKSNLLAALLRVQGIYTGFCYQRLTLDDNDDSKGYCLHALNAVYIDNGWHRIDARGNKARINAQFSLDKEQLAFHIRSKYKEVDYPTIYVEPLPCTLEALQCSKNVEELINNLPNSI